MKRPLICGALMAVFGVEIATAQTPPPNDNFTNAVLLSGDKVSLAGTLSNATFEAVEAFDGYGPAGSVWWKWVPTTTGPVLIQVTPGNLSGGRIDARLEVFRGNTLSYLEFLGSRTLDVPAGRFLIQSLYVPTNTYYYFRVSGTWQGSFNAQLTASAQPIILQQPQDCTVSPYGSATFSALATGIPRPTYQWMFNGTPLPGQTGAILLLHNVLTNVAGGYCVIVSNSGGPVQSGTAWLTVRDTNPVPVVTMLGPTNGSRVYFIVRGEPGRHYRSETTYDLNDWNLGGPPIAKWGQATNVFTLFSTYLLDPNQQFVAVSLDTPTDACIAQLQAMDSALNFYTLENDLAPNAAYRLQDLAPYFCGGVIPACPGNGVYSPGATVTNEAVCSLGYLADSPYDGGHHWP